MLVVINLSEKQQHLGYGLYKNTILRWLVSTYELWYIRIKLSKQF